jgi:superfamily II DNA or RNA helicase
MIPRDYQRAAVDAARSKTAAHGNTLVALPVGAGKTAVAGFYIGEEAAAQHDARFLVLQHTDELIEQNRSTIGRVAGLPASVVKAERDDWSGQVIFGSVQTLARTARRARMGTISHLVIDECHRAAADSYQAIIAEARAANPDVKLLGLSATPERGDGRSLRRTFSNIAYHLPISALIGQGILVPPRTFTIDLGIADDLDRVGAAGSDFDMDAAAKVLNRAILNEAVVEHWRERAADRRTIAFCATVAHAEAVAAAFRAAGITAETVTGEMPTRERADLLARFDRGEVQVITNCMVLTEGFDSQPVGCIVVLRPMLHRGTFVQAIGRGLRKVDPERFPGVIKTDCIVLDFAGAALRHGSIEHDGTLAEEDEPEPGQAPYKTCPSCEAEVPIGTIACPFCGHVWQRKIREKRPLQSFALSEVDILDRSPFRWWDMHGDGHAMMASGFDAWAGVFFDGEHWHAVGKLRQGRLRHLGVGEHAQVLADADDFLRQAETGAAATKSRLWLNHPASPRQRELLARAGDADPALDFGLSKYAANCRLNFLWNRSQIIAAVFPSGVGRVPIAASRDGVPGRAA